MQLKVGVVECLQPAWPLFLGSCLLRVGGTPFVTGCRQSVPVLVAAGLFNDPTGIVWRSAWMFCRNKSTVVIG